MKTIVAIVATGEMGSGIGRRLVESGFEVRTNLAGRSPATAGRARAAGLADGDDAWLAEADLFLSVVPPAAAMETAERFAAAFRAAGRAPVYVDLNAISPVTSAGVGTVVEASGARFVDGGIIGTAPRPGYTGPFIYVSGPHGAELSRLGAAGLDVTILKGPNGAASALKLSYAAIMKGLTAVGSASLVGAERAGLADALLRQLARSEPELAAWFSRQIPKMYPKTGRWVREMEEISSFFATEEGGAVFDGAARLFETLSRDDERGAACRAVLQSRFPAPPQPGKADTDASA